MALVSIDVVGIESTSVVLKASRSLVPLAAVEVIEVIAPVEHELVVLNVIRVHLNIVIFNVPGHVDWVESGAPRVEGRSPEVHSERLGLLEVIDGWVVSERNMAHFVAIDRPRDVVGRPLHLVDVPFVMGVETVRVIMRLNSIMAITVDDIHGEGVLRHRGHNFHIKLVPVLWAEVWTIPVGEEGRHGTLTIWSLHACDKLAVLELLESRYGSAAEVCLCNSDDSNQ